ncbi:MAG: aromatic acid exporter family protein [Fastidiosipila sp.]|nr:aromatic acid exporter family protein [Fastidiosipila sp.]
MTKEKILNSFKIAVGVLVAILLAKLINLEFHTTAATAFIVVMLSSKRQSLKLSGTLLLAAIFSLGLASLLFSVFGFSLYVFAIYILIFTLLMYKLDTKAAIIINVVLVMQIYSLRTISLSILANQLALMFIGLAISFVLNIFTLDIEDELLEYRKKVESLFESIYRNMGKSLNNESKKETVKSELEELDQILAQAKSRSYDYLHSFYLEHNDYYVEYFALRRQQFRTVVSMQKFTKQKFLDQTEVQLLRGFTDEFADKTRTLKTSRLDKENLEKIKHHFIYLADLPATNKQLRNRVALHQYLYALDNLVDLELQFIENYEKAR